jgi:hypothetical protein
METSLGYRDSLHFATAISGRVRFFIDIRHDIRHRAGCFWQRASDERSHDAWPLIGGKRRLHD